MTPPQHTEPALGPKPNSWGSLLLLHGSPTLASPKADGHCPPGAEGLLSHGERTQELTVKPETDPKGGGSEKELRRPQMPEFRGSLRGDLMISWPQPEHHFYLTGLLYR